jgi:HlyD family secretion protein
MSYPISSPVRPPRSRRASWSLAVLLALAPGCGGEKPIQVTTEKAQRRNLTELVTATGKIQPVVQVKISPEVSGEIVELPVKEGQRVKKGDLLVKIRRDLYEASVRSAEASLKSAEANLLTGRANARKAAAEFRRNEELFQKALISGSIFDDVRTALEVADASAASAAQQVEMSKAALRRSEEDLLRTTIFAPIDGTVAKLNSELGERVVGTGMMAGTEIMTVADLTEMEARVEVGEVDVVLIAPGQKARLEVDSFRDRKFAGVVTQVARSAKTQALGTQQESTKFEVRIHVEDKEPFLPGMSVTAEVETRYRTNVVTVPIQSVTTRLPKEQQEAKARADAAKAAEGDEKSTLEAVSGRKPKDLVKPQEVVFLLEGGKAKQAAVKRGISDDAFYEMLEGVPEGAEVIAGSFRAVSRELQDGKAVTTSTNRAGGFSFSFGGKK